MALKSGLRLRKNKPAFRGADRVGADRVEGGSLGRRSAARLGPEELLRVLTR
jgi:hypothetical protein